MPFIDLNNGNSSAQDDSSLTGQDQAAGNSLPPLEGSQDSSVEPIQNITAEQSALGSNAQSALKSPLVQPPSKQGDGLPPLKDVLMNQSSDDDSQPQQSVNNNLDTSSVNQQTAIETNGPDFQTAASQNPAPQVSNQGQDVQLKGQYSPEHTEIWGYLDMTESRGASDLHFTVGYPPIIRVDGSLQKVGSEIVTKEQMDKLFLPILNKNQLDTFKKELELDFSFSSKSGARFRGNIYRERGNVSGAFRLIPSKIKTINELNLPEILYEFMKIPHGLVLVTGPTGSGKSTTLAAMISEINMSSQKHIITLEDPIEYMYQKGQALVDQREIGRDTLSWTGALRSTLRQDPDVVLVGEMRDYQTIASTITIAETGHLVFATLHTNSAAETVDRIIDVFPEHTQAQIRTQLASVIVAVISQRLVPLKQGGRQAACEILIGTSAVRSSIRESKTYQIDNIIQTGADVGMFPLEKSLAEMVKKGDVTLDTAMEFTVRPGLLKDLLQ